MDGVEQQMAEALRRYWDGVVVGSEADSASLDPTLVSAIRQLHAHDARDTELAPDGSFVRRLEESLMEITIPHSNLPASGGPAVAPDRSVRGALPLLRAREGERRVPWYRSLATAAFVAVTLAVVFITYRLAAPGGNELPPGLPAAQVTESPDQWQAPSPEECRIAAVARGRGDVAGTPTTPSLVTAEREAAEGFAQLSTAQLPDGSPPDAATLAAIVATLREVTACRNARDLARLDAFGTLDSQRRANQVSEAIGMPTGEGEPSYMTPVPLPPDLWELAPLVEDARVLPDGRVGAIVVEQPTLPRGGVTYPGFFVFAKIGDRWLIDDSVEISDQVRSTLLQLDLYYEPYELEIPSGIPLTLTLRNAGVVQHVFAIDALGVSVAVQPGDARSVTIDAPAGEYEFYCAVPGHREAGMVGLLTVYSYAEEWATPVSMATPVVG